MLFLSHKYFTLFISPSPLSAANMCNVISKNTSLGVLLVSFFEVLYLSCYVSAKKTLSCITNTKDTNPNRTVNCKGKLPASQERERGGKSKWPGNWHSYPSPNGRSQEGTEEGREGKDRWRNMVRDWRKRWFRAFWFVGSGLGSVSTQ